MISILVCHSYFLRFDQKQQQRAKPYPPLASLQVAAMLRAAGHEVSFFDAMLASREWLSDWYSVLDPYAFVFYVWGVRRQLPVAEFRNYSAFKDRMLKRPAVQRVVADEGVKL